jgi:AraC family transcriptional regulator, alkane utilization regulator
MEVSVRKTVAAYEDRGPADQVVRDFRVGSTVLCRSVMAPPWGFGIAGRESGTFHMVIEGQGWLEVEDAPGPIAMRAGDVAILPTGKPHWMRDSLGSTAPPLTSILAIHDVVDGELRFGGDDGPRTEVVCGLFSFEDDRRPGWIERLPSVVVSEAKADEGRWRPGVIEALREEARRPTDGGSFVVDRLIESLIAGAIRAELTGSRGDGSAPTTALGDDRIGPALARLHDDPAHPWNVRMLADAAMMSRSAFAERFRILVGQPPMRYLTELRLTRASRLLRSTDATLSEVARSVGYGSEDALSRAFKNRFGEAPSAFRARRRAEGGEAPALRVVGD